MMIRKLERHAEGFALVLDSAILELLEIDPEALVDISTNGTALIVRPIRDARRERLRASTRLMMQAHHETLEKLAK